MTHTCGRPTANATPCQVSVESEGAACIWHDEARKEEARAMRSKGASVANQKRGKSNVRTVSESEAPPPPETLEDAAKWLSWLTWACTTGKLDGRTAHEATYALRGFLDSRKALDRSDERVKALQEQLAKLRSATA